MVAKDNKYSKVEGLLYSYRELPFKKKNLELELKLNDDNKKREELERIEITMCKIENMLNMIKSTSEIDYLIIKLRYIDGLEWNDMETQLHMSISWLMQRRRSIIEKKLLSMV